MREVYRLAIDIERDEARFRRHGDNLRHLIPCEGTFDYMAAGFQVNGRHTIVDGGGRRYAVDAHVERPTSLVARQHREGLAEDSKLLRESSRGFADRQAEARRPKASMLIARILDDGA